MIDSFWDKANVIYDFYTLDEAPLFPGYQKRHDGTKFDCNYLSNNIELKVCKRYGPEVVDGVNLFNLRNKDEDIRIVIRENPNYFENSPYRITNIILNYVPIHVVENLSKTIKAKGTGFAEFKNNPSDFILRRHHGKEGIHTRITSKILEDWAVPVKQKMS